MTGVEESEATSRLRRIATTRGKRAIDIHPVARTPEEWAEVLEIWGERRFRARQVFRWIHARGVVDPEAMTDLSKPLRQRLRGDGLSPIAELVDLRRAADGTRKLLLRLCDQRQ